jgi:GntR family transcriptional regulator/MocR family aminotransferase
MDQGTGIQIDPQRGEPLYKQIYDEIVSRIRRGTYPAGYRLPPARELAKTLSTHRNTVARAFEELEASGLVYSSVGRGTFVADQPRATESGMLPSSELPWGSLLSYGANAEPLSRLERLMDLVQGEDLVNLASMYPSTDLLPDAPLRRCLDHVLRTYGADAMGFAPRYGVPRLRELIAKLLERARVTVTAEDVMITTGSQQALDLIARALVNPGDTLLVDEYTYTGALNAFAAVGAHIIGVPSDMEGPDMDALRPLGRMGAKAFYMMPNCGNPTGMSVSVARRRQLVEWAHEVGVPLIEDDHGADLELDDAPTPVALRALDPDVLYVGTFSKRMIPALRVGFLVAPAGLRRQLAALKHTMDLGTSALLQHTVAEFIERGYLRAHLRRIIPAYRERRDALEAALREHLPTFVSWQQPRRGGFLWLRLPPDYDSEVVFEEAQRQGVLVSPGALHSVHRRVHAGLRLSFCAEPPERLVEGARRLGAAIRAVCQRQNGVLAAASARIEGV